MRIYHNTDQLPDFRRAVITIGTFDGVHSGHTRILEQLRQEATRIDGETVIITFYPHPRKVVKGGTEEIRLINTLEEKIQLLSWQRIDHLVIVPFTEAFSQLTAEEYITDFLVARFHPHTVIIGYDHRFGKGRLGDYHLLEEYSSRLGFGLQEIPVHLLNEVLVSSTRIREAIQQPDIVTANQLLGYPFFFSGTVVKGDQLGRKLGYPTANLRVTSPEKLIPADGIYAVEATLLPAGNDSGGQNNDLFNSPRLKGMMSIGIRPTVGGKIRTIEVNLFDFDDDIYGRDLRVFVRKWLREEVKFDGLEALKVQLGKDREDTLLALA
ncbi:bifunctional riboflavin kinase/FAD synthetase [Puia sp. P3]|uniref:bifunctional riboflavin kinase/FAD synthetase n=1 Tax=Puia sp. P3 TaxID=3423952 RepID=UPI003D67344A